MCICVSLCVRMGTSESRGPWGQKRAKITCIWSSRQFDPLLWMLWIELRLLSESNKDPKPLRSLSRPSVVFWWWDTKSCWISGSSQTSWRAPLPLPAPGLQREKPTNKSGREAPVVNGSHLEVAFVSLSALWPWEPVFCFSLVALCPLSTCRKGGNFPAAWWKLKSWTCKLYR